MVKNPIAIVFAVAFFCISLAPVQAKEAAAPVTLNSDTLEYSRDAQIVRAYGNVVVTSEGRTLLADEVTYNKKTTKVNASGNVRLIDKTGDVLFADTVELTDDLKEGFIHKVSALLTDDSRMAAQSAKRSGGNITVLEKAVYSPCKLCESDPSKPPLWQLKADTVIHDQIEHDIIYDNARMEFLGLPVLYTPYFSHPDPTVKRRSGFLAPSFGSNSSIGAFIKSRYYYDIAPSMDTTFELGISRNDGLLIGDEWRQRFENGKMQFNGAIVKADRKKIVNGIEILQEDRLRGYVFGTGRFDFDDTWRGGFDVKKTTDNSFLRRHDYSTEDILLSQAFTEGFLSQNDYAAITAYDFQDLRPTKTEEAPIVLPLAQLSMLGETGDLFGGRWLFDADTVNLIRDDGYDTSRLSIKGGWQRRMVSDFGLVADADVDVRGDLYLVNNSGKAIDPFTNQHPEASEARFFPQAQLTVSYPFVKNSDSYYDVIEPIVSYTVAPSINNSDIPNEDSRDVTFDVTNLFSSNRFPGVDRLEGGHRITYGLRNTFSSDDLNLKIFAGQSYRFNHETDLPINSGLDTRLSDYVGRIEIGLSPYINALYDFRLDEDSFTIRRDYLNLQVGVPEFLVAADYLFIDDIPGILDGSEREELSLSVSSKFSQHWSIAASHLRNMAPQSSGALYTIVGLFYEDECFRFDTNFMRDHTVREGIDNGDSIYFRLVFKNLGEVKTPKIATSFIGGNRLDNDAVSGP